MGGLIFIGLIFMVIGMFVQWRLKSKFNQYAQIGLMNGMSGAEVAAQMLRDNNIGDVRITQVDGQLTDHYNPMDKTVNLSGDVYHGRSVSAAAVAAHEVGHAVQHAVAYAPLKMRSALVPVVNVCNTIIQYFNMAMLFIGGYIFSQDGAISNTLLLILVAANIGITAFAFITLPVEFDASKRALAWAEARGIANQNERGMMKDALWWAATTYVVAAMGALANLLYFLSIFLGRRND